MRLFVIVSNLSGMDSKTAHLNCCSMNNPWKTQRHRAKRANKRVTRRIWIALCSLTGQSLICCSSRLGKFGSESSETGISEVLCSFTGNFFFPFLAPNTDVKGIDLHITLAELGPCKNQILVKVATESCKTVRKPHGFPASLFLEL